jgi:hypothetical protein
LDRDFNEMTRDDYFKYRTRRSDLTDDELLIFDCLWHWRRADQTALAADVLCFHANISFTHDLSDASVRARLTHWETLGWVQQNKTLWQLTRAGAALWEAERLPDWSGYVQTSQYINRRIEWLHVMSPNRRIASEFWRTTVACKVYRTIARPKLYRINEAEFEHWAGVPGREFSRVWDLRRRVLTHYGSAAIDWERYKSERVWWTDTKDLIALRLRTLQ